MTSAPRFVRPNSSVWFGYPCRAAASCMAVAISLKRSVASAMIAAPAPLRAAPCAPAASAASMVGCSAGKIPPRAGWWMRSSIASRRRPQSLFANAATSNAVRPRLNTASPIGNSRGMTPRADFVEIASSGRHTTARRSESTGNRDVTKPSRPATQTTNPPSSAAETLSGWPSISATNESSPARFSGLPANALAATTPATMAAALPPSPPELGIRVTSSRPSGGACMPIRSKTATADRYASSVSSSGKIPAFTPETRISGEPPSASTHRCSSSRISSARPRASNPGPRFADVAGT